jgi:hypothetical protein
MIRREKSDVMSLWRGVMFALTFLFLLSSSPVRAQGLPFDPQLEDSSTQAGAIADYIKRHTTALSGADREAVSAARAALVMMMNPKPAPSASFLEIYSREVAAQLLPVLESKDFHVRLNAALVVEQVAQIGQSPRLAPLAVKLLSDESPAIVLWGLESAQYLLPRIYQSAQLAGNDRLLPAVEAVADRFPSEPSIIREAYSAVTQTLMDRTFQSTNAPTLKAVVPPMIDAIHRLMARRAAIYAAGNPPVEVRAEEIAIRFLTNPTIWDNTSAAKQTESVQRIVDLLGSLSVQYGKQVDRKMVDSLRELSKTCGNGLAALASKMQSAGQSGPEVEAFSKASRDLMGSLSAATPATKAAELINATRAATAAAVKGITLDAPQPK